MQNSKEEIAGVDNMIRQKSACKTEGGQYVSRAESTGNTGLVDRE